LTLLESRPSPPAAAEPPPAGRTRRRDRFTPYALLLPAAVVLAAVQGYPLARLVLISLQRFGLRALFTGKPEWAGLSNYSAILGDDELLPVLARTVGFCLALVAGTLIIGMGVALMLGSLGRRMRTAVTLTLIAAWAMPNVAATLIWQWLFQPLYGVVDWLLSAVGILSAHSQYNWLAQSGTAFAVVWSLVVWQSVPFVALTLHAGLSQIPAAYYEAAQLSGAGYWTMFRIVTLPFLRPILLLVTILSVIWDFNVFNQIWILTQGGPGGGTTTMGIWSFTRAFASQSYGQGAAIAVLSVLLLMILTAYYARRLVRTGEEL
jgi:N,N'-diacetylchitobiose transport system permease protein